MSSRVTEMLGSCMVSGHYRYSIGECIVWKLLSRLYIVAAGMWYDYASTCALHGCICCDMTESVPLMSTFMMYVHNIISSSLLTNLNKLL